jgi:sugar O-acyltransferase (sialic acid O-acetyltransferase NeuD family)
MPDAFALLLYGANACGREIAVWAERATIDGHPVRLLGFIDDMSPDPVVNGRPVWGIEEASRLHRGTSVIATVAIAQLRRQLVAKAEAAGFQIAPPLIHPSVEYDRDHVAIGDGSVICPGTTLTTNIEIGRHVQINLHCTIAHDVELGDFVTLSPGCHVSGRVKVGSGAYFGTGAVTVHGKIGRKLVIGEGAVLGAGSAVLKDVPPNVTVFGVPARVLAAPPAPDPSEMRGSHSSESDVTTSS